MVGGLIIYANGVKAFVTAFVSTTSLTVSQSATVTSQAYNLYYGGLQADNMGNLGFVGMNLSSLTASQAVVTDAGKNLTSLAYATTSTSSSLMERDSNANTFSNNSVNSYATTVTAAGTTTLTAASARYQYFTGSTTQTVVLPVVSTLAQGFEFRIVNNSTGSVTVQSSGLNAVATIAAGSYDIIQCILVTGTTAASWNSIISLSAIPTLTSTINKYDVYASTTCNNTTTETDISTTASSNGSLAFVNAQALGGVVELDMHMLVTSALGDTLTIRHKVNGTTIFTHTIAVPLLANSLDISMNSKCVMRSSTIQVKSTRIVGNTPTTVTANSAYNFATANTWSVTAQWGSNVNSLTMDELVVDVRFMSGV
jgi:hypothetical protein